MLRRLLFVLFGLATSGTAPAQSTADALTNETVIRMVQAGVPTETTIKTIANAERVDFTFVGPGLQRLTDTRVPVEVFKAMVARTKRVDPSAPSAISSRLAAGPSALPQTVSTQPSRPSPQADTQASLTNESLVKLAKAGMGEDLIVTMVNNMPGQYSLAPDSLIAMKQAGVSDKVIAAVVNRNPGVQTVMAVAPTPVVETILVPDGTPLKLRLTRDLSSADAVSGDTVEFEVLEDVKVDDVVIVAHGSAAVATVMEAENEKHTARGGKLDINIKYARLVNGDWIALRAAREASGDPHAEAANEGFAAKSLAFFASAPFLLFTHDKESIIPKGTKISAYVDGEIKLDRQRLLAKR